jgi:prepilin peptidase CpaA
MIWIPVAVVLVATVYDLRRREIPDWVSLVLLGWAILATAFQWHAVGWLSLLGGLALGFGLTLLLFALGAMGGGDVKLTAALGAALGYATLLPVLFWIALAGGLLALVALIRGQREIAFVPAIALGLLTYVALREGLASAIAR